MNERAPELPGLCLVEARRVFGDKAEVVYGARYATAGAELDHHGLATARELTVVADDPLVRLLTCLRALPEVT